MKKLFILSVLFASITANAITINDDWSYEINPYAAYASSFIYNSGSVCDENPVFQLGFDNYLTYKNFSFYHGIFQNYGFNTIKEVYTQDGLDDLEFYLGGFYTYKNFTFGLVYEYWFFPHLVDKSGNVEQVLHPSITYSFDPIKVDKYDLGKITLGFDPYFYLGNDPYDYLIDWRPYVNHKIKLATIKDSDLTFNSRVGTVLRNKTSDSNDGWSSAYTKFTLSYRGVSLYYYHWFRMNDTVYSDWNYDKCHNTVGVSYTFSF